VPAPSLVPRSSARRIAGCDRHREHRVAGPVAQWLEPAAHNGLVAGSSPAGPTKDINRLRAVILQRGARRTRYVHFSFVGSCEVLRARAHPARDMLDHLRGRRLQMRCFIRRRRCLSQPIGYGQTNRTTQAERPVWPVDVDVISQTLKVTTRSFRLVPQQRNDTT
jgi:hypothetical protein